MKAIKIKVLFMALLILLQGCVTVYRSEPITLEKAVTVNKLMRVITKGGQKVMVRNIISENGNYYAVKKENGEVVKIPLESESIKSIKVNNGGLTLLTNFALGVIYVIALASVGSAIWPISIF